MNENQIADIWMLFKEYADKKAVESLAERYVDLLADHGISVDAMLQQPGNAESKQTELIILTHEAKESTMALAMSKIQKLPTVLVPVVRIRAEDFN